MNPKTELDITAHLLKERSWIIRQLFFIRHWQHTKQAVCNQILNEYKPK